MTRDSEFRSELDMLCRRFGLADVYVFGSRSQEVSARVRGEPDSGGVTHLSSDIDIGVQPLHGVSLGADDVVRLAQELECLFGVPRVDLVLLPGSKAFLALDVIRGELLYCSDRDAQAEHELYILRRAGDLAPFQKAREDLVLSRYLER